MTEFPRLRPVEVVASEASGRPLYVLRDASGLTGGAVTVSEDILFILHLLDGEHSLLDIRAEYMRKFGSFLFEDQLEELLGQLDDSLLIEGARFNDFMLKMRREFRELDVRPASHAGAAYPGEADALLGMLDDFFTSTEGPGAPPSLNGRGGAPKGLVLPHIDIRAGGPCLAWGYHELAERELPDLFVILGTGHSGPENNFAITDKDFETPLGRASTDRDFVAALLEECDTDFMAGELAHKSEHSVEFQVVFLQYLYRRLGFDNKEPRIAPVLCSFCYGDVDPAASEETASRIQEFCSALRNAARECGASVCYLASADLAHLGPRYGDRAGLGPSEIGLVRSRDLEMLKTVERGDADGLVTFIGRERDGRRVCGFSCIYALLKAIEPTEGRLLKYSHAAVDDRGSIVSFASLVLD